jgi:hypothetical protein
LKCGGRAGIVSLFFPCFVLGASRNIRVPT